MPGREPTPEDGPLFRSAHEHADAVDRAGPGAERRKAWTRFIPSALVALAEGFLREAMITGAVLFSVIAAVIGATSGEVAWAVACVASGVVGVVLVLVAVARHWSFGRQWAVLLGVLALQVALMVTFWQTS
ncbi:hypothetical protein [Actinophytocola gossypii]|uniref:Uncharacterized protein n=1 Tax=Actinophytocola gossypii TaxID=2812003 RepID=A0ABT2J3P6_9PSEU|nr:hypothetical protein [Actinophytocola gossypii]MCT2582376.1 hypothetical protein [Actinophytocola gossypii]